ncbi:MAG: transcription termination/antitermination factor NusG [Deinococcus sp.]|nr:transcription termination/antitermination factor NusG [Deinococcus sp.]
MAIEWYAVHTYVGSEQKVKQGILQRAKALGMNDKIYQILIPTEEVIEHREGGQKEVVERHIFPGYLMIQMDLGDDPNEFNEAWDVVRGTAGVTGFVGTQAGPVPLTAEEVARILGVMGVTKPKAKPEVRVAFEVGDVARVTAGPFADFTGIVSEINPERGKVKVRVSIFGRETPVELDFSQVEKA